jgi:hypothetical protein
MKLSDVLKGVSEQLRIDFEELATEIEHPGESGTAREKALRALLSRYLPERAAIGSVFVIDATGDQSRQVDVVIYDRAYGVDFEVVGKHFFPCETVLAVGEVKSQITSTERLREALGNIASVKSLDRRSTMPITGPGLSTQTLVQFDPTKNQSRPDLRFRIYGSLADPRELDG